MSYQVKQGDIFGRIGTGFGRGLAEQLPKEMEHGRLSQGLQQFEQDVGQLSPMQQVARFFAIPGITPQMSQSLGELAKIQNQRNAFANAAKGAPDRSSTELRASPDLSEVQQEQLLDQAANAGMPMQRSFAPGSAVENRQRTPNVAPTEDIPSVVPGNPLSKQNLPRTRWTPQERNSVISDYINQGFLPDQAQKMAADDEERYLSDPEVYRKRLEDIETGKDKARDALTKHLEKKLQKKGDALFEDVEGVPMNNAERGMIRDLILNPKADIDNVANDWSERLYNTALAKGQLRKMGKTTGIEAFSKGNELTSRLRDYQDIFKRSGNLQEFESILKGPSFGMSDQAAASIAYPPNNKINEYISKMKPSAIPSPNAQSARKAAIEIGKFIGPDDSIQAIARKFSDKDPYFDQRAFLDQISEDKDELGLNERQRREIAAGSKNILPNWADLLFLPIFRR